VDPTWVLSLPEEVTVLAEPDGGLTFLGSERPFRLRQVTPALRDTLVHLEAPGERVGWLAEVINTAEGPAGLAHWYYHLQELARRGLLHLSVCQGSDRLATLEPIASTFVLPPGGIPADHPWVLSRFAWLRRQGTALTLESPLSPSRIVLHDSRAITLIHALARPGTTADLLERATDLPVDAVKSLLRLLIHAGTVCAEGTEDTHASLRYWQFHDLLFHTRSRDGRQDGLLGASYPFAGRSDPEPALRPKAASEGIALFRPDLEQLRSLDPSFAQVQEARRSVRDYAAEPISDRELGEFLFRVFRVKDREQMDVDTPAGPVPMDFAFRPYPSGGALYELELYTIIRACTGLTPGLYHYDGLDHRLLRRAGPTAEVERLLDDAAQSAGMERAHPQVLLVLTARLPRLAWKYTGFAYALILKHVGVVFQTMYLAATAMGLAPCAVGGGDSDRFARAAGLDYYAETSVGEFLLGSSPDAKD
jgi:oxazoline/thiazoline dehydrogenase